MKCGADVSGCQVADARGPAHCLEHPRPRFSTTRNIESVAMRTFYFDTRDGVPTRDRKGLEFPTAAGAIEHSKELVRRLRSDPRLRDSDLSIAVIDESGAEIHREPVYADPSKHCVSLSAGDAPKKID
jgi:hypothetical protein